MLSEIGSNFWISPNELFLQFSKITPEKFGCKGSDYVWMSTGRGAISFVLDTIERRNPDITKVALLPPFTCNTVIEPFLVKGYEVKTFHTGKNLRTTGADIVSTAHECNAGVVLFHRYFGVDSISNIDETVNELRNAGIIVIEDCTQCLYSTFKRSDADYIVGSIRKWCGVPDGGFAVCKDGRFENKPKKKDAELEEAKKKASILKYQYLFEGVGYKNVFLTKYREAEDILNEEKTYFTISDLSAAIQGNLDVENLKQRRRDNYKIIAEGLKEVKGITVITEALADDEVPLYCPIFCEHRFDTQKQLVKNAIYAPVVWLKADCCPAVDEDADYLYDHILCIPIDQRYDEDDMKRVINTLIQNK